MSIKLSLFDSDLIPAVAFAKENWVNVILAHALHENGTPKDYDQGLWLAVDRRIGMSKSFFESLKRE